MFTQRLSSLEFYTYAAFFAVVVGSISAMLPGRKAPMRTEPYTDDELKAHDRRLPKYFLDRRRVPACSAAFTWC